MQQQSQHSDANGKLRTSEQDLKFEDIQRIFHEQGVTFDIRQLIEALLTDKDTDNIMAVHQQDLKGSDFKKLQKGLSRAKQTISQSREKKKESSNMNNELDARMEDIKKIFQEQGVTVDIHELIEALLNKKETERIMAVYQQDLKGSDFKKVQKALARIKDFQTQNTNGNQNKAKILEIDRLFTHQFITHDLKELKQHLINKTSFTQTLKNYEQDFSGKEFKKINEILNSRELKELLDDQVKQIYTATALIFSKINIETKDLQKYLIQNDKGKIDQEIKKFEQDLPGKDFKKLLQILKSDELASILKNHHNNNKKDKATQVKQILMKTQIKTDFGDLANVLVKNDRTSINKIMKQLNDMLSGKQYKLLLSVIESKQLKDILQNDEKSIIFDEMFKPIKANLDVLKQAVLTEKSVQQIEQVVASLKNDEEFQKILQIIQSELFISQFGIQIKYKKEEKSSLIKDVQNFVKQKIPITFDLSVMITKIAYQQPIQETLKEYEQKMKVSQFKKLKSFLDSQEYQKLTNLVRKNLQKSQLENKLKAIGLEPRDIETILQGFLKDQDPEICLNQLQHLSKKKYTETQKLLQIYFKKLEDCDDQRLLKLRQFFQDKNFNFSKQVIQDLVLNKSKEQILKKYEDELNLPTYNKLMEWLNQLELFTKDGQNEEQKKQLDKLFPKKNYSVDLTQFKKSVLNSEPYDQIMLKLKLGCKKEQKQNLERTIQSKQFENLLKAISLKNQEKMKMKKIQDFFIAKKVDFDIQEIEKALIKGENIFQPMMNLQKKLGASQYQLLQGVINSQDFLRLFNQSQLYIKKWKFVQQVFIEENLKHFKFYKIKDSICRNQISEDKMKQFSVISGSKEFEKVENIIKSNFFKSGFKKLEILDYSKKFQQLSKLFNSIQYKKDQLLERFLTGIDFNEILEEITLKEKPYDVIKFNQDFSSQEVKKFFNDYGIEYPIYIQKIPIYTEDKVIYWNRSLSQFRKQYSTPNCYKFFTLTNQAITDQSLILQNPVNLLQCQKYTIFFKSNQGISQFLPNFTIGEIKKILQKILVTDLKLNIKFQINDTFQLQSDQTFLRSCLNSKIFVSYFVKLLIQICEDQKERQLQVQSTQSIDQISKKVQKQAGIKKQNQKWYINANYITETHKTIEQLDIKSDLIRVYIDEQKTLEFYGFNKMSKINRSYFKNFYIQDDQQFKNTIKSSQFPKASYSQIFRNQILGYIFSAVKKHSLIDSSLKHVQSLVQATQKQDMLWRPPTSKEKCLFNQTYVIYHVLKSSDQNLKIDLLRGLMSHLPVPLAYSDQKGQMSYLFKQNYWIQNKAFNICSFGFDKNVMGKSDLLNLVFETNFPIRDQLHKDCQGGIQIEYNIYKSDEYSVNLIDISNDIEDQVKIELSQASNLVIIHYKNQTQEDVNRWLFANNISCPKILVKRDQQNAFSKQKKAYREDQKKLNKQNKQINKHQLIQISDKREKSYYDSQLNQIANGIQQFTRKTFQDLVRNQKKIELWKFIDFLAKKSDKKYLRFNQVLKVIQTSKQNLTEITNFFYEYKEIQLKLDLKNQSQNIQKMEKIKEEAIKKGLAKPIRNIIQFYKQHSQLSSQIMAKLRIFLTLLRNQLFRDFNDLQALVKSAEKKKKQNNPDFCPIKQQILEKMIKISQLKQSLTTKDVLESCHKFIKQHENYKNPDDWADIVKIIKTQFEFQIQPKAFSVQNFWRQVIYMTKFNPQYKFTLQDNEYNLKEQIVNLGRKEVQDSQNFEFINGDLLEMPTQYLKSIFENQEDKKIMVVAIFGPQSSGKSTLLNYVLGCDFMSSAGRCTKGIYGTYFEISNKQIPNCEAILVLDTEGLFSNYENKKFSNRNGFDNKLVLFCLQVCDIIILNTKGDVTKDCQQVLELAFDSTMLDSNNLPEIYFVLNLNGGQINPTQARQVQKFCNAVIKTNPDAKDAMNKNRAVGMPMAFNEIPRKSTAQYITKFLKPKLLPSDRFYSETKKLCFELMNLLTDRGDKSQGRTLQQAFTKMDQTWATINKYPILTKFGSKQLKKKEQQIKIWKKLKLQQFTRIVNDEKIAAQSLKADQIQQWNKKKIKFFDNLINKYLKDYQNDFPQKPGEISINNLIRDESKDIEPMLLNTVTSFNVAVQQVKCKQQIQLADNKGFGDINRAINDLKQIATKQAKIITDEQKKQKFQDLWKEMKSQISKKLSRQQISHQIYANLLQFYNNSLTQRNHKNRNNKSSRIMLQKQEFFKNKYQQQQNTFVIELKRKFKKSFEGNNFIFECSNQPPVMNIEKKKGDITFKYLDMSKYFEETKTAVSFIITKENLREAINYSNIQHMIKLKMQNNQPGNKFLQKLSHQFKMIGVTIKTQKLRKAIDEQINAGFWSFLSRPYTLMYDDVERLDGQWVQQKYWDSHSKKQKSYSKWSHKFGQYVSYLIYNQPYKERKNLIYYDLEILNIYQVKKILEKQLDKNDRKTLFDYYTIRKISIKIANHIIKSYVKQNCKSQQNFINNKIQVENQILKIIQKDLRSINVEIINPTAIFNSQEERNFDFRTIESISDKILVDPFQKSLAAIKQLSKDPLLKELEDYQKSSLYGLQKQATVGDNNTDKPWVFQKGLWKAWTQNKGKSKQIAKKQYVQLAQKILKKYENAGQMNEIPKKQLEFPNQKQLKFLLQSFSQCFDQKKLQNFYHKQAYTTFYPKNKLFIGYYIESQVSIKQAYKNNNILKKYLSKQYNEFLVQMKKSDFTKFLSEELKYEPVLQEIQQEMKKQKIQERALEDCANKVINIVSTIINDMNKDLSQASQKLRYDFIHQVHFYSFHIAWKIKQQQEWKNKTKFITDFENRKEKQMERFMELTSGNPAKQNRACASKFIQQYKKFLKEEIRKDIIKFLEKRKQQYKQDFSRAKVQTLIDDELYKSKDPQQIFGYLIDPVTYIKNKYQSYQQQQVDKAALQYKFLHFDRIIEDIKQSLVQFRDCVGNSQKNIGEQIFQRMKKDQNINKCFIPLIVQVLQKGYIDKKNQIGLKMKQGKSFSIERKIKQAQNKQFLQNLLKSQIEVTNLKIFLGFVVEEIDTFSKEPKQVQNYLNQQQKKNHRISLAVDICKEVCPCCSRNCDVDMYQEQGHTIHRCDSGHQMRAIGGMRMQFQQNGELKYKASIQRCENLKQDFEFQFNNKPYTWAQFKLEKQNVWDLNLDDKNKKNQLTFKHYWQMAGQKICQHYQAKDKLPMIYVKHELQELKKQTQSTKGLKPTHYIFGLDQSYSMQGDCWNTLMIAMKQNIATISNTNKLKNQYVSIFKFNSSVSPQFKYKQPINADMNAIVFGGGGTRFAPAFKLALQIMQEKTDVNHIFVLVSDGQAQNPSTEVKKIKDFQTAQKSKGLKVEYSSFLIGSGGGAVMEAIRQQLNGHHKLIPNASSFTSVFKEVMKQQR